MTNIIMEGPLHFRRKKVDEVLLYSNILYLQQVHVETIFGNSEIIFEDCVFDKSMTILAVKNHQITFYGCKFKSELKIINCCTDTIDLNKCTFLNKVLIKNCQSDNFNSDSIVDNENRGIMLIKNNIIHIHFRTPVVADN